MNPREQINEIERNPKLPDDERERFRGYSVVGVPFRSGHILGLRRWPASSIGPGYTTVWHRDPSGYWTFYSTAEPRVACNRYFGGEVGEVREADIDINWTGAESFRVTTDDGEVDWRVSLESTAASRFVSNFCSNLPDMLWRQKPVLKAMGAGGGRLLHAGEIRLEGRTPNLQEFEARPLRVWMIPESRATVNGIDFGEVGPTPEPAHLGDFTFPQRGLFAIAETFMEVFDPKRHRDRITRTESGILSEPRRETSREGVATPAGG